MTGTTSHAHSSRAAAAPVVQHLPPRQPPLLRPSLPIGVAILSFLLGVAGLVLLLTGAIAFLHQYAGTTAFPDSLLISSSVDVYGAAILLVLGAAIIALARALWDQELWALYLMVTLLFAGLAYEFFTASITVLFLVLIVLFIYLLAVRHHFY
ncbi:MAG: hypothetical protein L3K04_03255 [Thermoplasmata archaeon]|nr:hypothetical protein [Thermoplasmata archaeon]MCI4337959.1 hypothetical protein [Thermoplasmata archaeon]MCI4341205.1 hypothetical protein [Thermoplasmata archaeon]